jgi:hypothetical protein
MSGKSYLVDVLTSQSSEFFDGATFLAASSFNCLEFVGGDQTAADGVTGYYADVTQGPAAVYRNYFAPHSDGAVGQLESDVKLLNDTPISPFVVNGYPTLAAMADYEMRPILASRSLRLANVAGTNKTGYDLRSRNTN